MPASPEVPAPQGAQGRSRYRPEGASPVSPNRSETLHPSTAATLSASFMRIPPIPSSVHQRPTVSLCTPAASASPCMVIRRSASSTLTREIIYACTLLCRHCFICAAFLGIITAFGELSPAWPIPEEIGDSMAKNIHKPGEDNQTPGRWVEVGPRGGEVSNPRVVHIGQGDRLPPTQQPGRGWVRK